MKSQKIAKKALSALLASTLVFSLVPSVALAAQTDTSTSQPKQEQVKDTNSDKKTNKADVKEDEKKDEISLDSEIKNETKQNETKKHQEKEVDKSKFAEPNYIQKEVEGLFSALAFNSDPVSFISMYLGAGIQRFIFALGENLINSVGSAFFGGPFGGTQVTANQVAFLLTKLDEKAKVVAAESKDLADLIKNEAKGSVLDDFNAHMNRSRGLMVSLLGQYNKIMCCNDPELKASLVAKMNIERERTLSNLLAEKSQLDNYILGEQSLSGKNIYQIFDGYVDAKYGFSADSYDIKRKFRAQILTFSYDLAKYAAVTKGDMRTFSPFAGQLEFIEKNDKRVTEVVQANTPDKVKKNFHINAIGKDVKFVSPAIDGNARVTTKNDGVKRSIRGALINLQGFNEDHTEFRYFSKGRTIKTPVGLLWNVEFYTNNSKADYPIGETFDQKFVTESEFKNLLAKKPAGMKVEEWIERAAGLEKGTCPRFIILGEKLKASSSILHAPEHEFTYTVYEVEKERFNNTATLNIIEPPSKGTNDITRKYWEVRWYRGGCEKTGLEVKYALSWLDFFSNARTLAKLG